MKRKMRVVFACLLLILIGYLPACANGVHVRHHRGWGGPDTWEATDGKVSVSYYNGDCCCVAEQVLKNLADRANRNDLSWSDMADPQFRNAVLAQECEKVRGR